METSIRFNSCIHWSLPKRLGVSEVVHLCQGTPDPRKETGLGGSKHLCGVLFITWAYHLTH